MSSNGTNSTNTTTVIPRFGEKQTIIYVYYTSEICISIVGTLLNLWFLIAFLTSRDMRSRLRNKIICNTLVVHLFDSAIIIPGKVISIMSDRYLGCVFYSFLTNFILIQDFIVNWIVVMLLVVFIAHITDFDLRTRLTPRVITLGTIGLLILPWIASLIVVPVIVHDYYFSYRWARVGCFYPTFDSYKVFKSIDTTVPIMVAIILLIRIAVLRYKQPRCSSGSMQEQLITSGPEIDNISAYVAAVIVCIVCDLLNLIMSFDYIIFFRYRDMLWLNLKGTSIIISDARVLFMVLPWLLLPDVRERIKTWRPWNRSHPGIDLNVTFKTEDI